MHTVFVMNDCTVYLIACSIEGGGPKSLYNQAFEESGQDLAFNVHRIEIAWVPLMSTLGDNDPFSASQPL